MNILSNNIENIKKLCRQHKVKALYAFGSVFSSNFSSSSDVDLIVEFSNISIEEYADNYFDFKFSLEKILNRKLDLLEENAIKNPYLRKEVEQQKQLVYAA